MSLNKIKLGVNVDHVATIRNARGTNYPSPYAAAELAKLGGADGITIHLREDRRHIVDSDVKHFCNNPLLPINLEMAATSEMQTIALKRQPYEVCIVPEKREELTTEGGLDVVSREAYLTEYIAKLKSAGIKVSLFVDPEVDQIQASKRVDADIIELHTGAYAEFLLDAELDEAKSDRNKALANKELDRIKAATTLADSLGLIVNAGHGLTLENVAAIAAIPQIYCLNIGHAIVARAVLVGFEAAVREMTIAMSEAR